MSQIKYETIKVYNWFDLQKRLCEIMEIEEKYFRNYHDLIGGDYKDFWHVALDYIVPEGMSNDTMVEMWPCEISEEEFEGEPWQFKLIQAWNILFDELREEPVDEFQPLNVKFSW